VTTTTPTLAPVLFALAATDGGIWVTVQATQPRELRAVLSVYWDHTKRTPFERHYFQTVDEAVQFAQDVVL
jgi:hypothetical protein